MWDRLEEGSRVSQEARYWHGGGSEDARSPPCGINARSRPSSPGTPPLKCTPNRLTSPCPDIPQVPRTTVPARITGFFANGDSREIVMTLPFGGKKPDSRNAPPSERSSMVAGRVTPPWVNMQANCAGMRESFLRSRAKGLLVDTA